MIAWFSIIKALLVRGLLIFHVLLCTWRVSVNLNNSMFWLILIILGPLLCESAYTIIARQGREFTRFTPCFFFYLGAVLPCIWFLELDRTDRYIEQRQRPGGSNTTTISSASMGVSVSPNIWLIVMEEMMPYVIFISRWILPRGKISSDDLVELLFAFIDIGADIMEFLSLFDENVVRGNKTLAYIVLTIWTFCVFQFTMTITVVHQPNDENAPKSSKEKEWAKTKHEIFTIFLKMFWQDLPFVCFRLYIIIYFNRIDYSLVFFTSKNILIIVLLLYKVIVKCKGHYCPDPENGEEAEEILGGEGAVNAMEEGELGNKDGSGGLNTRLVATTSESLAASPNHYSQGLEAGLKKRTGSLENNNLNPTINDDVETHNRSPNINEDDVLGDNGSLQDDHIGVSHLSHTPAPSSYAQGKRVSERNSERHRPSIRTSERKPSAEIDTISLPHSEASHRATKINTVPHSASPDESFEKDDLSDLTQPEKPVKNKSNSSRHTETSRHDETPKESLGEGILKDEIESLQSFNSDNAIPPVVLPETIQQQNYLDPKRMHENHPANDIVKNIDKNESLASKPVNDENLSKDIPLTPGNVRIEHRLAMKSPGPYVSVINI